MKDRLKDSLDFLGFFIYNRPALEAFYDFHDVFPVRLLHPGLLPIDHLTADRQRPGLPGNGRLGSDRRPGLSDLGRGFQDLLRLGRGVRARGLHLGRSRSGHPHRHLHRARVERGGANGWAAAAAPLPAGRVTTRGGMATYGAT